jgi:ADP-ribose pyrophosphatase
VGALTDHQALALDRYAALLGTHPALFAGRTSRPIVTDLDAMRAYAAEHGTVLGVVVETPFLWLLNDLVESSGAGGTFRHPYLRLIPPPQLHGVDGVAVLATTTRDDGLETIAVLRIDRHATGETELELPRGFGSAGSSGAMDALRELAEETGLRGGEVCYLGRTLTDTGTTSGATCFFHILVEGAQKSTPEAEESIESVIFMTRDELWSKIDSGEVRDAFTVQALALYELRLRLKAQLGRG